MALAGFMPDLKPGYNLIRVLAPHGEEALAPSRTMRPAHPSRRDEAAAPQDEAGSGAPQNSNGRNSDV
jgi:hypothetical protein